MLSSHVLILNRSYLPVHITTVKRAMVLLYQGVAKVVDNDYQTFDFGNWVDFEAQEEHETIGLVDRVVRVPRVLLLAVYDRVPQRKVRFSRKNIFLRDRHTCQYCGVLYGRSELNLDHVVPRSRGGKTNWENVVCCCVDCNHRKGGHLPQEIGMDLIKEPAVPRWVPLMDVKNRPVHYEEWRPYLSLMAS